MERVAAPDELRFNLMILEAPGPLTVQFQCEGLTEQASTSIAAE